MILGVRNDPFWLSEVGVLVLAIRSHERSRYHGETYQQIRKRIDRRRVKMNKEKHREKRAMKDSVRSRAGRQSSTFPHLRKIWVAVVHPWVLRDPQGLRPTFMAGDCFTAGQDKAVHLTATWPWRKMPVSSDRKLVAWAQVFSCTLRYSFFAMWSSIPLLNG